MNPFGLHPQECRNIMERRPFIAALYLGQVVWFGGWPHTCVRLLGPMNAGATWRML